MTRIMCVGGTQSRQSPRGRPAYEDYLRRPFIEAIAVRGCRLAFILAIVSSGITCVGGALSSTSALAQSAPIRAIEVSGNKRVEPETVRSYLQFSVGSTYDPAKVDGSIKALFATGLFSDVRIERSGADVIVTVVESRSSTRWSSRVTAKSTRTLCATKCR